MFLSEHMVVVACQKDIVIMALNCPIISLTSIFHFILPTEKQGSSGQEVGVDSKRTVISKQRRGNEGTESRDQMHMDQIMIQLVRAGKY